MVHPPLGSGHAAGGSAHTNSEHIPVWCSTGIPQFDWVGVAIMKSVANYWLWKFAISLCTGIHVNVLHVCVFASGVC